MLDMLRIVRQVAARYESSLYLHEMEIGLGYWNVRKWQGTWKLTKHSSKGYTEIPFPSRESLIEYLKEHKAKYVTVDVETGKEIVKIVKFVGVCRAKILNIFMECFVVMGSPRYVGFVKPEWGLSRALKMWGVSVPPKAPR